MFAHRIPISWAKRQAARAVAAGLSLDHLFDRAMISPEHGDDRDFITPLQLTVLQTIMVLETNDGSQAMLRHRLDPGIGPLAFRLLFGAANLEDGLHSLTRLYDNTGSSIRFALSTAGALATLSIRVAEDHTGGLCQEDIQLIYLFFGLTRFVGRPFPVSFVTTRDTEHPNLGSSHYAMGCPVKLGRCAGMSFPRSLLPCAPPQPALQDFIWQPVREAFRLMEGPAHAGNENISNRTYRVQNLAAERSLPPSTFRRRLAQEGASFRMQREQALIEVTIDLLGHRSCSLDAIAAELGYADARSLRRFIKRSTGRTPDELRSDMHMAAPPAKLYARLRDALNEMALDS